MARPEPATDRPRRRLGIRAKLLITVNAVLLVGLTVLLVIDFNRGLADRLHAKQVAMAEEAALVLAAADALEHHGGPSVQAFIDRACAQMKDATSPGHHIAVRLGDRPILQARTHDRAGPEFARAMQAAAADDDHQAPLGDQRILVGSRRQGEMVVYVSEFTGDIRRAATAQLLSRAAGIAVVGVVLAAIINVVLLRVATRPIGQLARTVHRIGRGELGLTPPRSSTTELDGLAVEIGAMSRSLADAEDHRRHQMAKARRIQEHLMPRRDQLRAAGIHHVHLPAEDVGGDFFDVRGADATRTVVYIGDVTGHGVPAAMSAGMLKALFEHHDGDLADPAGVLRQINRRFDQVTLDGDFATMFMGVIDRDTRTLTYASAGHETCYLLRADGRVDELPSTGILLGAFADAEIDTDHAAFEPGDRLVLLTDGLTETMSPQQQLLGRDAIIETLGHAGDAAAEPLAARLLALARDHRATGPQLDDITLVVVEL